MDDADLLARFAADRSEAAFAELVRRHVDFVYSSALRQLSGNHHHAQDVTQMVFIDLARKAAALARHPSLAAWLHRCTRYTVFNTRRKEARRLALNKTLLNEPSATQDKESSWEALVPALDEAVDGLPEKDRAAILLRFFAKKPFADVGRELGVSENAARMRVDRAVEALRSAFERRGIRATTTAIGSLIAIHGINAAPASVTPAVTAAVAASGAPLLGALSLFYTMSKIKVILTAALLAIGAIGLLVEVQSRNGLRAEAARLQTSDDELTHATKENLNLQGELQRAAGSNPDVDTLARTRKRIALIKARPKGVTDARMKPIMPSGRGTPEAAYVTFLAAVNAADLATVKRMVIFRDGASDQQRADYMKNFSEAVRHRYPTPEDIAAAAYLGLGEGATPRMPPSNMYQVFSTEELFPGIFQLRLWLAGSSGEREDRAVFKQTSNGWSMVLGPLNDHWAARDRSMFDPVTGLPKSKKP